MVGLVCSKEPIVYKLVSRLVPRHKTHQVFELLANL